MWRYVFLYFFSAVAFLVCGLSVNAIQLILFFTLKRWNLTLYQKVNYYLSYTYFSLYNFIVDWYSDSELNVYMDKNDFKNYFGKEHSFVISNHSFEIDWILMFSLAEKGKFGGNSKTFIKNDLQFTPGFGMIFFLSDYVCLARSFEKDKLTIQSKVKEICNYPDPVWLILYPEGTSFSKNKHELSLKFAKEKGLPEYQYHLTPRTKGFITSLEAMKDKMKAVYDVTIMFDPNYEVKPLLKNLFAGKKIKVHFYIKRIPFENIPKDEKGARDFIFESFKQKDKLRDSFYKTGDFFTESGVERVDRIKMNKNYKVLINALAWYIFSVGLILNYLLNLLLSGSFITFAIWIGLLLIFAFIMHKAMGKGKLDQGSPSGIHNKNK